MSAKKLKNQPMPSASQTPNSGSPGGTLLCATSQLMEAAMPSVGALMRSTARMKSRSESGATHAARLNSARGGAPPGRHVPSVKLGSPDTRRSLLGGAEGGTTSGLTLTHREVLASGT